MDNLQPFPGDQDERPPKKRRLSGKTSTGDQQPAGDQPPIGDQQPAGNASSRPNCINRIAGNTSSSKITELNFTDAGLSNTDITELILYIQQRLPALQILCLGENNALGIH